MGTYKKVIVEAGLIVVMATTLGIIYNFISSKPLPLIREESQRDTIPDYVFQMENEVDTISVAYKETSPSQEIKEVDTATKPKPKLDTTLVAKVEPKLEEQLEKQVSYDQLVKNLNNPNVVIVDARSPEAYALGHIDNAINIFPYMDEAEYFPLLTSLPYDKIIIVYCDGGNCDLSHEVAKDLLRLGYRKVFIFYGGWAEWEKRRRSSR